MNDMYDIEKKKFNDFYRKKCIEGGFVDVNKNMSKIDLKVRQLCNTATKRCFRKSDNEPFDGKFEVKFVVERKNNFPICIEDRYYDFELNQRVLAFEKMYKCHLDRFFQDLTDYYCLFIRFEED